MFEKDKADLFRLLNFNSITNYNNNLGKQIASMLTVFTVCIHNKSLCFVQFKILVLVKLDGKYSCIPPKSINFLITLNFPTLYHNNSYTQYLYNQANIFRADKN